MIEPDLETIKKGLNNKSTQELLKIWEENDCFSWTEEAFMAIKEILIERGVELPDQNTAPDEPKKTNDINSNAKYGIACIFGGIIVFVVSLNMGNTMILPYGLIGFGLLILAKDHVY